MQTIVDTVRNETLPAAVRAVISNKSDAAGLDWARQQGIEAKLVPHREYATRAEFDRALMREIDGHQPHYVLLAGFMRVLTPEFVAHYEGRLINIHPSLLPAFPGLHTHQQALATGVQWHGCTIHFVTQLVDHGPIVAQGVMRVYSDDTPDTLAKRLLDVEHQAYARVVRWLAQGRVALDSMQRVQIQGVRTRSFMAVPDDLQGSNETQE